MHHATGLSRSKELPRRQATDVTSGCFAERDRRHSAMFRLVTAGRESRGTSSSTRTKL